MKWLTNKQALKRLVACCLFLLLAWQLFAHLTYLFRNADTERQRFVIFAEQAADSLDVVYLGASAVFVFWDPMYVWNQYGFTSYDYATSNMPATLYLPAIQAIAKAKRPRLFLVDIRAFLSSTYEYLAAGGIVNGGGYRSVVDSLDLSLERARSIAYSCKIDPASKKDARSKRHSAPLYRRRCRTDFCCPKSRRSL